jgi:hypothetical protein
VDRAPVLPTLELVRPLPDRDGDEVERPGDERLAGGIREAPAPY